MDLIDLIKELSIKVREQKDSIKTEEATKNAFIMPFIKALGYDVFDPTEVEPEFTADIADKKGEKVDYVIKKNDKSIILIECKWSGITLTQEHINQLTRYFTYVDAKFAVLTNGIIYRFYSDLESANIMDVKPFFEFDLINFDEHQIKELKRFTKPKFDVGGILESASTLKYTGTIKKILYDELSSPSEAFVKFFARHFYQRKITKAKLEEFTKLVKEARTQFIDEQVNERLKSALASKQEVIEEVEEIITDKSNGIETTQEEIDGFNIVRAILSEVVDIDIARITIRDTKNYCGVLLDNTTHKPICRMHFNKTQKYLGLFTNKIEDRIAIEHVSDIFKYAKEIKSVISEYDS